MELFGFVLGLGFLLTVGRCSKLSEITKNSNPKPCCTAQQFETGFGAIVGQVTDGKPSAFEEELRGAFDFTSRQYGMNVSVQQFNGTALQYRVIQLFNKGKAYVIQNGFCQRIPPGQEPQQCVPDSATYTDSFYLGNKALLVDNWYMAADPSTGLEGALMSTTSRVDCTVGSITFVGTVTDTQGNKVYMTLSGGYMNFTEGIKDPDQWFVPPDICGNSTILRADSSWPPMQHWKRMQKMNMFL